MFFLKATFFARFVVKADSNAWGRSTSLKIDIDPMKSESPLLPNRTFLYHLITHALTECINSAKRELYKHAAKEHSKRAEPPGNSFHQHIIRVHRLSLHSLCVYLNGPQSVSNIQRCGEQQTHMP